MDEKINNIIKKLLDKNNSTANDLVNRFSSNSIDTKLTYNDNNKSNTKILIFPSQF